MTNGGGTWDTLARAKRDDDGARKTPCPAVFSSSSGRGVFNFRIYTDGRAGSKRVREHIRRPTVHKNFTRARILFIYLFIIVSRVAYLYWPGTVVTFVVLVINTASCTPQHRALYGRRTTGGHVLLGRIP